MGFGFQSASVLGSIIKLGSNLANWTHIDLSLNKLGLNLSLVINGLKANTKLVALRLSNNELGGRDHI